MNKDDMINYAVYATFWQSEIPKHRKEFNLIEFVGSIKLPLDVTNKDVPIELEVNGYRYFRKL